jgi:hypothetical protein
MYESIRKPGLLKNIPLLFIRALPSIYYYGKFGMKYTHTKCKQLYHQNLEYLICAIDLLNKQMHTEHLNEIIKILDQLKTDPHMDVLSQVERFTIQFSDYCNLNVNECRSFYKENKQKLIDLYREKVSPLHILITDVQPDQKLPHLLYNFCYYNIQNEFIKNPDYTDKLSANDFVVLTNIDTNEIHRQIEQVDAFHKPAMIVVGIDDPDSKNKPTIRHAMQLIRRGFPVIFKILTPIRLFTSVEKTFFNYHAQFMLT